MKGFLAGASGFSAADQPVDRRRDPRLLVLILLLSLVLNVVPFWWGLPSNGSWAFDEIQPEHLAPAQWPEKYPLVHRDLLRMLHVPLVWLADLRDLSALERRSLLLASARLLSVFFAMGTVVLVYRCGREIGSRCAALFSAWVIATVPLFVYYAKTANLEAPYLFWFTLSLLFYLRLLRRQRWRDHLGFAVAAVLAIGTKDQAYGLYVLSPLAILAAHIHYRRAAGDSRPWLRSLLDPKVWVTGVVTAAGLALVYRVAIDPSWLPRHVAALTGPAATSFRQFANTLPGHLAMALQSVRHIRFSLGLPLLILALYGMWRSRRARVLLLLAVSYYIFFISIIGFHYVRFFLPVCVILSLVAGHGLARLWHLGRRRSLLRLVVVAVLTHAGLRAATVDLLMLRDVRYDAERLLASEQQHSVALGVPTLLPRIEGLPWRRLSAYECRALEAHGAHFVVIHPVAMIDPRVVTRLLAGEMGYRVLKRFRQKPLFHLLDFNGIHTNLEMIAREVVVFERHGDCLDASDVMAALPLLGARSAGALDRSLVTRLVSGQRLAQTKRLGDGVVGFGLSPDFWTYGAQPAAITVDGGSTGQTLSLTLVCSMPQTEFPFPIHVDDGERVTVHICEGRGRVRIPLPRVPAGEKRLFIFWAERSWVPENSRRLLGVRLERAEARVPAG